MLAFVNRRKLWLHFVTSALLRLLRLLLANSAVAFEALAGKVGASPDDRKFPPSPSPLRLGLL